MIASTESRSESESSITIRGERVLQQTVRHTGTLAMRRAIPVVPQKVPVVLRMTRSAEDPPRLCETGPPGVTA
jgi:hypothetical protein